jgi:serine/threonine-protein kinase
MSNIYKAVEKSTGRVVAIKQILPRLASEPTVIQRVQQEAEILARLQHPNIVRFYEMQQAGDQVSIVMEYVEGSSIRALIDQRLLDEDVVCALAYDILQALDFVHRQGIIWGDPKPANMVVTTEGRLVLLDFGISRYLSAPDNKESEEPLTVAFTIMGTPAYMAPEQVRGEAADQRSDIYSIGVVLFQMATGQLPHDARSLTDLLDHFARGRTIPQPSKIAPVSSQLERVIMRCLRPDPNERYQTVGDILKEMPSPDKTIDLAELALRAQQEKQQAIQREEKGTELAPVFPSPNPDETRIYETSPTLLEQIEQAELGVHPYLIVTTKYGRGVEPLDKAKFSIGRSESCDIVLFDDEAVSRYHANLTRQGETFWVEDLNSSQGTVVNGEVIRAPVPLNDRDQIRIGSTVMIYMVTMPDEMSSDEISESDVQNE